MRRNDFGSGEEAVAERWALSDYSLKNLKMRKKKRCSSVVRAFVHGAMGRRIDHSWGEPIELFLVPASAPRLV